MCNSWPVTPTCCLPSENLSPLLALLEMLLHQPLGHPMTVLPIEIYSKATDCSTHEADKWHSAVGLEYSKSEWIS